MITNIDDMFSYKDHLLISSNNIWMSCFMYTWNADNLLVVSKGISEISGLSELWNEPFFLFTFQVKCLLDALRCYQC